MIGNPAVPKSEQALLFQVHQSHLQCNVVQLGSISIGALQLGRFLDLVFNAFAMELHRR